MVRKRSPAGSVVGTRGADRPASTKPHSPNDGTYTWYGATRQPRLLDGRDDAPVGLAREERRRGLHDERGRPARGAASASGRTSSCTACRARSSTGRGSPRSRSRTCSRLSSSHVNASALTTCTRGSESASPLSAASSRCVREEPRHLRIEIDQGHGAHLRVAQHLAQRQPVAAAEDQHARRRRQRREPGVHERLVVAVLVARAELQVAVEEQPQVVLPRRHHDALVAAWSSRARPRRRTGWPRRGRGWRWPSTGRRRAAPAPRRTSPAARAATRGASDSRSSRRRPQRDERR